MANRLQDLDRLLSGAKKKKAQLKKYQPEQYSDGTIRMKKGDSPELLRAKDIAMRQSYQANARRAQEYMAEQQRLNSRQQRTEAEYKRRR